MWITTSNCLHNTHTGTMNFCHHLQPDEDNEPDAQHKHQQRANNNITPGAPKLPDPSTSILECNVPNMMPQLSTRWSMRIQPACSPSIVIQIKAAMKVRVLLQALQAARTAVSRCLPHMALGLTTPGQDPPNSTQPSCTNSIDIIRPLTGGVGISYCNAQPSSGLPKYIFQVGTAVTATTQGEYTKIKSFHNEALKQWDLLVFGYMCPVSPFIHMLHTVGTFSHPSGDEHYGGKDVGFVGNKTVSMAPTPVHWVPNQSWKWITKKLPMDVGPLEQFYALLTNNNQLYQPLDYDRGTNYCAPMPYCSPTPFH